MKIHRLFALIVPALVLALWSSPAASYEVPQICHDAYNLQYKTQNPDNGQVIVPPAKPGA